MKVGTTHDGRRARAFELPIEAVTQTFAILGLRGSGKSNAAKKLAEEMYDAGAQWVAIDPKGDWHGLRSSADGKRPGLSIPVFGGLHGDMPLAATAGAVMAELIVEHRISCVLDVSDFASKAEAVRFLTDFGTALLRAARRSPSPLHLFLEEADEFLPQVVGSDMTRCVGIWNKIFKQGRTAGLGATIITQRSAAVNKNALSQVDTLIAMRTSAPNDRKVVKEWVDGQTDTAELVKALPQLVPGEAVVWSPYWLEFQGRVQFDRVRTFDSGATPVAGEQRPVPVLADIDLSAIAAAVEATVEEQAANDPKVLRDRVRDLERQLAAAGSAEAERIVEVEVVKLTVPWEVEQLVPRLQSEVAGIALGLETIAALCSKVKDEPVRDLRPPSAARRPPAVSSPPAAGPLAATAWPSGLAEGEIKVLTVLALAGGPVGRKRLAIESGYKPSGSTLRGILAGLRKRDFINTGDPVALTAAGAAAIPGDLPPRPTGPELLELWYAEISDAERPVLQAIMAQPDGLTPEQLGAATGKDPAGSTLRGILAKLRARDFVAQGRPIRPTPDFLASVS